jgi:hypothetical protein
MGHVFFLLDYQPWFWICWPLPRSSFPSWPLRWPVHSSSQLGVSHLRQRRGRRPQRRGMRQPLPRQWRRLQRRLLRPTGAHHFFHGDHGTYVFVGQYGRIWVWVLWTNVSRKMSIFMKWSKISIQRKERENNPILAKMKQQRILSNKRVRFAYVRKEWETWNTRDLGHQG